MFNPRVGKIPWRRERLPTPVFWPEQFHGQYSQWGHKESDTTEQLSLCQVALVVKNLPANAGDLRDAGLISGSERSPGGGHGSPLQYSCLVNPKDRKVWWVLVHRIANSQTRLKQLSMHKILEHVFCGFYFKIYMSIQF